jgi:NADH-quinone oxidoreductase subunit N
MNSSAFFTQLAPEWILLIGAGVVLFSGVVRGGFRGLPAWLTMITVVASLAAAWLLGAPDGTFGAVGLWLTPVTYYVRLIALGVGLAAVLVNWRQPADTERGEYFSMILFSLLGVLLTASANDGIVLFFAIELVSVPTYVLIGLSREDARASEAAVKYFFLGAMAAAFLAYGLSFWYGAAGTTTLQHANAAHLASTLPIDDGLSGYVLVGFLLILAGLAFKVAAVPLHLYVPDVYEGAASPVAGFLGFAPKLAGIVALIKVCSLCHWQLPDSVAWLIGFMAAATMTAGNVLALMQNNVKRILAYSSIAHTGYMLIGLLVGPVDSPEPFRDGVTAMLFYMAVYGTMNLGAFAMLSAFQSGGRPVETLQDLEGVAGRAPWSAAAFAVCVFSLMGFPPTAGFLGKVYIFGSAFAAGSAHSFQGPLFALAILGVVNSAIGAAYYLRIVAAAYLPGQRRELSPLGGLPVRIGLGVCALILLVLFLRPSILTAPSQVAGWVLPAVKTLAAAPSGH